MGAALLRRCACCGGGSAPVRARSKACNLEASQEADDSVNKDTTPLSIMGRRVLVDVREIEDYCKGKAPPRTDEKGDRMNVEKLHDEPDSKYYMCASLESSTVTGYLRVVLGDVSFAEVVSALVDAEERRAWNADSDFRVLRNAESGDADCCEDVYYIMKAPWPFYDREILAHRWRLPLQSEGGGGGAGVALCLRSFRDDMLLPLRDDGVRATIHHSAHLIRTLAQDQTISAHGVEVVAINSLDLGGFCPPSAQAFLTRLAVQRALQWASRLRDHCIIMRKVRKATAELPWMPGGTPGAEKDAAQHAHAWKLLESVLAIEMHCLGGESGNGVPCSNLGVLEVECLLDEPDLRYCLCSARNSPNVIGCLAARYTDVYIDDVLRALTCTAEQLARDPFSEFRVLRKERDGDPLCQEDVAYALRAPWPFSDREVHLRRWQVPLKGGGVAVVARSVDDGFMVKRPDRVRATMHRCGHILRPISGCITKLGVEVVVCTQMDVGGYCPIWAQDQVARYTAQRSADWAARLGKHCRRMRQLRGSKDLGHCRGPLISRGKTRPVIETQK